MNARCLTIRITNLLAALVASLAGYTAAIADTTLSSFEGDLSSAIGKDWEFYDASGEEGTQLWAHQFVNNGVTDGAQALQITHFSGWTHGFKLAPNTTETRNALVNLFATHDTLEFDLTTPPNIQWRQIFVIVNSSVTGWSQVQIDIPANATTHFSMPLTNPDPGDATKNWKQSAIDGGATATYWEIFVALQGADFALTADFDFDNDVDGADFMTWQQFVGSPTAENGDANFDGFVDGLDLAAITGEFGRSTTTATTTIDNIKFGGGPPAGVSAIPEPTSLMAGLLGLGLVATMAARRRR